MSEELIKRLRGYANECAGGQVEDDLNEAIAALTQQTEPIGEVKESGVVWANQNPHAYPIGTKFYTAPQSGVREGMLRAAFIVKNRHDQAAAFGAKDVAAVCAADYTAITRAAEQVNTDTVSVPRVLYQQIKLIAEEHARDVDDAGGDGCVICKHIFGAAQEGKK